MNWVHPLDHLGSYSGKGRPHWPRFPAGFLSPIYMYRPPPRPQRVRSSVANCRLPPTPPTCSTC